VPTLSPEHLERILAAAVQAPSGDNWQPWRFLVSGHRILVYRDPQRDRSPYNVLGKADLIALGAAIENASLMAGQLGYTATEAYFPDPRDGMLAAALTLQAHPTPPDPLADVIRQRVTNRLPYRRAEVPAETWRRILGLVGEGLPGRIAARWDRRSIRRLARILSVADHVLFGNPRFHASLYGAIRWKAHDAQALRDGLPIETLGLKGVEAVGLRLLRSWRLVRRLHPLGLQGAMAGRSRRLTLRSAGLVSVGAPSADDLDFLLAGRLAQRLWLACAAAGLAVQPVTGLLWMALRLDLLGGEGLSPRERADVGEAWRELRQAFDLEDGWRAAMLFRIGFAGPPRGRTQRRPVSDCLLPGDGGS
jgi:nitroreductase